jgi:hypothetical protein
MQRMASVDTAARVDARHRSLLSTAACVALEHQGESEAIVVRKQGRVRPAADLRWMTARALRSWFAYLKFTFPPLVSDSHGAAVLNKSG